MVVFERDRSHGICLRCSVELQSYELNVSLFVLSLFLLCYSLLEAVLYFLALLGLSLIHI